MRNINFIPSMYRAIAFMTCMMLLMFFSKSKAATNNLELQKKMTIGISKIQQP